MWGVPKLPKLLHHRGDGHLPGPEQQVKVVRYQCPCVTTCLCVGNDMAKPINETITVCVIIKDPPTLNSTHYEVMKSSRSIYSRFTWHKFSISHTPHPENYKYVGRPQITNQSKSVPNHPNWKLTQPTFAPQDTCLLFSHN